MVAYARNGCEATGAEVAVVKVEFQRLHFILLFLLHVLFTIFLAVFFAVFAFLVGIGFLLVFFSFLGKGRFLFGAVELVPRVAVESHQHHVVLFAPRTVAAHTVTRGVVSDGTTSERPAGIGIAVTAFCEVNDFCAVSLHEGNVGIVPAARADIVGKEPAAVGTPGETYVTVLIAVVVFAGKSRGHLPRGRPPFCRRDYSRDAGLSCPRDSCKGVSLLFRWHIPSISRQDS